METMLYLLENDIGKEALVDVPMAQVVSITYDILSKTST